MPRHHVVSCVIFMIMGIVSSFVTPSSFRPRMLKCRMSIGSVSEATTSIKDSKGNDLKTGSVVMVTAEGLKAHQVSTKGHGTFVDGNFVPTIDDDGLPKGRRYFELPVGICGAVTKVYDVDDISANFPIQVKFQPGKYNEETGFDPPVAFLMHFSISEVELVSS
jgi:hypothetical protein